jgi:hypothetical protein
MSCASLVVHGLTINFITKGKNKTRSIDHFHCTVQTHTAAAIGQSGTGHPRSHLVEHLLLVQLKQHACIQAARLALEGIFVVHYGEENV